jgi:hypothetical protein
MLLGLVHLSGEITLGELLVGFGTLALASFTWRLATATKRTAALAGAEVRAQWRPALVPSDDVEIDYLADDRELLVGIRNVGRGPAFYVRAGLTVGDQTLPAEAADPELNFWNSAVMPVGDAVDLRFQPVSVRPEQCELLLDYLDTSGRAYATRVSIDRYAVSDGRQSFDILRMSRARLFEEKAVTPWGVPGDSS